MRTGNQPPSSSLLRPYSFQQCLNNHSPSGCAERCRLHSRCKRRLLGSRRRGGASGFNKQSNAKLHCGKLAGPGFTIGVGGLSLWDGHKVPTIIWYPTTNNRQRGILHPNIMLESRERETLRSTLPFLSVQVLYHTGKYVVVFANKSSQSLDCTNATPLFFYQSSYPPSLYLPIWMLARSK